MQCMYFFFLPFFLFIRQSCVQVRERVAGEDGGRREGGHNRQADCQPPRRNKVN